MTLSVYSNEPSSERFESSENAFLKSTELFEVYRKSKRHEVTMNRLCQFSNVTVGYSVTPGVTPSVTYGVICRPDMLIWSRRKSLDGVHFKVGVNPQVSLLAKDNKVSVKTDVVDQGSIS